MVPTKTKVGFYQRFIKRLLDFIVSLVLLIILSPLFLLVAIVIKLTSRGPVFFTQLRPGKNQRLFIVYKFRTMVKDAVKHQKAGVEVLGNDERITKVGKVLRRLKIDELPQLINILKGDMSIVGPRPSLPDYLDKYEDWELKRFCVRPGLTGLAQVNGNIHLSRIERSYYDIQYVDNLTFWLDFKIILKTIAIVFMGEEKFVNKPSKPEGEEANRES